MSTQEESNMVNENEEQPEGEDRITAALERAVETANELAALKERHQGLLTLLDEAEAVLAEMKARPESEKRAEADAKLGALLSQKSASVTPDIDTVGGAVRLEEKGLLDRASGHKPERPWWGGEAASPKPRPARPAGEPSLEEAVAAERERLAQAGR
jgi:hypothetical protein